MSEEVIVDVRDVWLRWLEEHESVEPIAAIQPIRTPTPSVATPTASSSSPTPTTNNGSSSNHSTFVPLTESDKAHSAASVLRRMPAAQFKEMGDLVYRGIPANLRSRVWFVLSGAANLRASYPENYYRSLLEKR